MLPWTFVTNHAVVLSLLARNPIITGHELALEVGISERAIRRIISELYNGPRKLDRVICYTWERKRGGPSGEFEEAASAVV